MKRRIAIAFFLLGGVLASAQDDVVLRAMKDELKRTMSSLQMKDMEKPYFVAYRVDDVRSLSVSATLGSLTSTGPVHHRTLGVELRVGDYKLDNTNFLSIRSFGAGMFSAMAQVPVDDNYLEIRRSLWLATDRQYKRALEDITGKRAALQARRRTEDVPDFSHERPLQAIEPQQPMSMDTARAEQLARDLSAVFRQTPQVMTSAVDIALIDEYSRYINSEGTEYAHSKPLVTLQVKGETRASDGLPISDTFTIYGKSLDDLLGDKHILDRTRELAAKLSKVQSASVADRYNGPVLFEGEAAAEIFADLFAPGLVAARSPMTDDPQSEAVFTQLNSRMGGVSFAEKIGSRVLPDFVDVTDAPQIDRFEGTPLAGAYRIDDEGVPSRETKLVEGGIVKAILASRTPVASVRNSTGSRRGIGACPSNLIFNARKTESASDLRADLLKRAKERGKDYAIIVRRAGGGGTNSIQSFFTRMQMGGEGGTTLLEVARVYPDGHEEIIRGAELTDVSVAIFKDIVAAGDKRTVYTDVFVPKLGSIFGFLGGGSPDLAGLPVVSYVVPSLLFDDVSIKQATGPFPNPPLTKPPLAEQGNSENR